jgi:glycosyltransferase involved in cell wall biosynthesis
VPRHHVVFHQFDPTVHAAAGISLMARDLIEHGPPEDAFSVVGVDSEGKFATGAWTEIEIGARRVRFMPVARIDPRDQSRKIPHAARFAGGVLRYRPATDGATMHAHRAEIGALLATLHRGVPLIQFIHGDAEEFLPHRSETFWRFAPRAYPATERFVARRAVRTIVPNIRAYERLSRTSTRVAYSRLNWFDGRLFRPTSVPPDEPLRIGWAGRFEPPKDPLLAVAVFARLNDLGIDFSAWMAGQGTLERKTRAAIERAGLAERVQLLGLLEPADLAVTLAGSTVFLMTSRWEGMPRGALEALGSGVPVVSTNVGELRNAVQAGVNGFLSGGATPEELGELVVAGGRLARGPAVAETVADYELQRVVEEIFGLIDTGLRE